MIKKLIIVLVLLLASCQQKSNTIQLQKQIDSLKTVVNNTYKPGFGETMNVIEGHYHKLAASINKNNWEYAKFNIHEMEEAFENLKKFQTNRKEIFFLNMIEPPIKNIEKDIDNKDTIHIKSDYKLLTKTCNDCHRKTGYSYIAIKQ